ncbi:hypothetical protein CC86DRAFT_71077 [Ophiobolus disseminans]|uniref:Uncharacterized protein n=1 Tax=Ophiobolus disseminans TaxID=1469910 RepID=A0A6A6ZNT9_9PLEO|nr:hypothetical protein CC86DRAFT_71077 [Ophiobolus disseminans]
MATFDPPRHRGSSFLHRHRSSSSSKSNTRTEHTKPTIFEGTDAVARNRKVAVHRIVEAHAALASGSTRQSPTSPDPVESNLMRLNEVRAFRHFLRMWDHNVAPDPEFDHVLLAYREDRDFERDAIEHFFKRIDTWHKNDEESKAVSKKANKERKKVEKHDKSGKVLKEEAASQDQLLEECTTMEGLAQLLWTLMHDQRRPLAPQLLSEYTEAMKRRYKMNS